MGRHIQSEAASGGQNGTAVFSSGQKSPRVHRDKMAAKGHTIGDMGRIRTWDLLVLSRTRYRYRYTTQPTKDYEIVSPESGELRILRYNSERHDSTSMIFGRQITAVEAEVKYKFWLRGGSVRHKSPTYICLETADSWI
ncbi:hypothetical protein Bbelb_259570 [Branchiostoma belcheri]|nr:hypothetical protein Bbelb_259570 [Branchiostoma belcheri]